MPPAFEYRFTPRFRDLDPMGHVNNAVYLTYLEDARVAFFRHAHAGPRSSKWPFVLKRVEIEYHRAVEFGDDVVLALSLARWGTSSFTFAYEARVDGDVAFTAKSVQVYLDPETGRPRAVPDDFRNRLDASLQNL